MSMSKATMFKETRTYDQGAKRHIRFQSAICSRCEAFENHPIKGHRPMPPEPLVKFFQNRGWVMGSSRAHDVCPDCIKDAAEAKRKETAKRNKFTPDQPLETPTAKIISITPKEPEMKPADNVTSIAPRQPGREDKRLIILSIEDKYLGPDKGYAVGCSDDTVAHALNVPTKWVTDLRDEFFGPLVNPEIANLKVVLNSLVGRMDAHEREGRELRGKVMDMKERLSKLAGGGA